MQHFYRAILHEDESCHCPGWVVGTWPQHGSGCLAPLPTQGGDGVLDSAYLPLVDEYRLFVYPVVQGRGRRLFPEGFEYPGLRLLEAKTFGSGVTYARYAAS